MRYHYSCNYKLLNFWLPTDNLAHAFIDYRLFYVFPLKGCEKDFRPSFSSQTSHMTSKYLFFNFMCIFHWISYWGSSWDGDDGIHHLTLYSLQVVVLQPTNNNSNSNRRKQNYEMYLLCMYEYVLRHDWNVVVITFFFFVVFR